MSSCPTNQLLARVRGLEDSSSEGRQEGRNTGSLNHSLKSWTGGFLLRPLRRKERGKLVNDDVGEKTRGKTIGCIEAKIRDHKPLGKLLTRSIRFTCGPLHLLSPVWKPRKALLRSVIRGKNTARAKKQSDRSNYRKRARCDSKIHLISENRLLSIEGWRKENVSFSP